MQQLEPHRVNCTCEVCFAPHWDVARAAFLLPKVPPPVRERVLRELEWAVAQEAAASGVSRGLNTAHLVDKGRLQVRVP